MLPKMIVQVGAHTRWSGLTWGSLPLGARPWVIPRTILQSQDSMPLRPKRSDGARHPVSAWKSASHWLRLLIDSPSVRCILGQRIVNSVFVMILHVITDQSTKMCFIQRDDMIQNLAATAYPVLCNVILGRCWHVRPLWVSGPLVSRT